MQQSKSTRPISKAPTLISSLIKPAVEELDENRTCSTKQLGPHSLSTAIGPAGEDGA